MNARPILFSSPMVRALLDGRKSQTRRAVKPQPLSHHWSGIQGYKFIHALLDCEDGMAARFAHSIPQNREWDYDKDARCPYGRPGDLLWVRETFLTDKRNKPHWPKAQEIIFDASPEWALNQKGELVRVGVCIAARDSAPLPPDQARSLIDKHPMWFKRPGIHMPRWASRLTLRITDVRVQRLQDISEEDAEAEGVTTWAHEACARGNPLGLTAAGYYEILWETINGEGAWQANPWVWALTFDVIHENVDKVLDMEASK